VDDTHGGLANGSPRRLLRFPPVTLMKSGSVVESGSGWWMVARNHLVSIEGVENWGFMTLINA